MKIEDVTTSELRRMLQDTERLIGAQAIEVRILRRELDRRQAEQQVVGGQSGGGE